VEWLEYHRHDEIKNLICNTAGLQGEVDNLLRADHAIIIEKLDAVCTTLASLLSQVAEFRGLSVAMVPEAELSNQAVHVLRQLVNSDAQYIIYTPLDSTRVGFQLSNDELMQFTELRFLKDDLDKLVSLGLLTAEFTGSDTILFHITRNAVRLIGAIEKRAAL
jgi:hypothetical protein